MKKRKQSIVPQGDVLPTGEILLYLMRYPRLKYEEPEKKAIGFFREGVSEVLQELLDGATDEDLLRLWDAL